jgi:hypothetical protein
MDPLVVRGPRLDDLACCKPEGTTEIYQNGLIANSRDVNPNPESDPPIVFSYGGAVAAREICSHRACHVLMRH